MNTPKFPTDIAAQVWRDAGLPADALGRLEMTGGGPVLPSSFRVDDAAQASIGVSALAAAEIQRIRSGEAQNVSIDRRHAAAEFRSERYMRVAGEAAPELWDPIAGAYPCGDGRWVRIHTNFEHHRDGILSILGCENDRDAVTAALASWEAETFETAVSDAGFLAAMMRSPEEWQAHPQSQAVAALPLVSFERLTDDEEQPEPSRNFEPQVAEERPLDGIRVLDLSRILAGPVCGRTLAAHGAEVLRIGAAHLPFIEPAVMDTGRGKRTAHLDLEGADGKQTLYELLADADVFVQAYRPGALEAKGFSADYAAKVRPDIVYVSLSAYGHTGLWANKPGFDSLTQTATGINHAEMVAFGGGAPRALPAQVLDHASGYLMAFGAMAGLIKRETEGGGWHVRVSLAGTGHWLQSLGQDQAGIACADQSFDDVQEFLETTESGFGAMTAVCHAGQLEKTLPRWDLPSVPLGTHEAVWPKKNG